MLLEDIQNIIGLASKLILKIDKMIEINKELNKALSNDYDPALLNKYTKFGNKLRIAEAQFKQNIKIHQSNPEINSNEMLDKLIRSTLSEMVEFYNTLKKDNAELQEKMQNKKSHNLKPGMPFKYLRFV